MGIVLSKGRRCQEVPGERGILVLSEVEGVVGVEVSKGRMDFVAVGREGRTEGRQVKQDRKGFEELRRLFRDKVCKTIRAIVRRHQDTGAIARARPSSLRWVVRKASGGRVSPERAEEIRWLARESIAVPWGQACWGNVGTCATIATTGAWRSSWD